MTASLESAFEKISALLEIEQNIYAKNLLDEIESEKKWANSFFEPEDLLYKMADDALKNFNNENTYVLEQDRI